MLAFWTAAALLSLSPGTLRATYLFELSGAPVGTVELRLDGHHYEYRSRQLFVREQDRTMRTRMARLDLDEAGNVSGTDDRPEALALARRPSGPGCHSTVDELTRTRRTLCVDALSGDEVRGRLGAQAFRARYEADRLARLELGAARFTRVEGPVSLDGARDVLGSGLPVDGTGASLRLEPPTPLEGCPAPRVSRTLASARALAAEVHAGFASKLPSPADFADSSDADSAGCLGHTRRYLAHAGDSAVAVFGLLVLPGGDRAFPHAWVRVRTPSGLVDLDPTSLDPVTPATHLPLLCSPTLEGGGELWLRVLFGGAHVRRL